MPGLVLGVGELIIDYTPGWAAEESIENLGTAGKGNLLLGITIVAFVLAGLLGEQALKRGDRFGVGGFFAFGLLGGWAAARNPQSSFIAGWFWALVAAGLGIATLRVLLTRRGHQQPQRPRSPRSAEIAASPLEPPHSRRAFMRWSAGAGAVALTGVGVGRAAEGTGAGDLARREIVLPDATAETATTFADGTAGTVSAEPFDVPGLSSWITPRPTTSSTGSTPPSVPADRPGHMATFVHRHGRQSLRAHLRRDPQHGSRRTHHHPGVRLQSDRRRLCRERRVDRCLPRDLLDRAGVQDGATQIVGRSVDDFTAGFPTETAYDGRNAMLVVGQNGEPLQVRHGFPARLVVAGLYGYVSATKWIEEINLTTWEAFNGYWIDLGWSKDGPMKTASRIDVPQHRSRITAGTTPIAGVAWSPVRGIQAVEISIDEGPWQACDLAVPGTDESWVQWKADWNASPGCTASTFEPSTSTARSSRSAPRTSLPMAPRATTPSSSRSSPKRPVVGSCTTRRRAGLAETNCSSEDPPDALGLVRTVSGHMTSSRRTYVLDTSVLLSEPQALRQFEEHAVVLPLVVLTELEAKRNHPELGWAARTALRSLEELRERHASLLEELPVNEHGGTICVELNHTSTEPLPEALRSEANDHRILTVAHNLAREGLDVTLVTKDLPLRLKAGVVGLDAAEYRDTEVADGSWTGFTDLAVESAVVDEFYDEGVVDLYEARDLRSTPASRWSPARSRASAAARGQADPSHPRPVRVRRPAPLSRATHRPRSAHR